MLAPSLTHATTAAVLRSGWAALGGSGESAGLAVNLSSERIRRARWIVDGVREGQDLARLLGARFERGLHDATPGLDEWIDDIRQLALEAVGSTAAPNAIVDGLLLARAWSRDDDLDRRRSSRAREARRAARRAPATTGDGLEAVLDSLAADLDAVADAAVAQSVFSLAQGNVPEATATLTAAATGEVDVPGAALRRHAAAGADDHAPPRSCCSIPRRRACGRERRERPRARPRRRSRPGRRACSATPAATAFAVRFDDPATGATLAGPVAGTLADLGLSALDLVYLAPRRRADRASAGSARCSPPGPRAAGRRTSLPTPSRR